MPSPLAGKPTLIQPAEFVPLRLNLADTAGKTPDIVIESGMALQSPCATACGCLSLPCPGHLQAAWAKCVLGLGEDHARLEVVAAVDVGYPHINGAGNKSSVDVPVERTSPLVLLASVENATAASALAGFTAELNAICAPLRQSLTYVQGKEMMRHADLATKMGVRVYFCDPRSPWQRGTCENTNGWLRQYLPKATDLSNCNHEELDAIADSLNARPRATQNWRTPLEVFAAALASSHQPHAYIH